MKESIFFRPIKDELEKNKEATETVPLTFNEHDKTEQKSLSLKDYWLNLRQSIQEKIKADKLTKEEQETTKALNELITPKLMDEYKHIVNIFNKKTTISKEHPNREFINVNDKDFSNKIEDWINNLVDEVKNKKELDSNDVEELKAQSWFLFDSIANVINTKSLEKDISSFYEDKKSEKLDEDEQKRLKIKLVEELQARYSLDKVEIEILVDLVSSEKGEKEKYSPKILVETIAKLWNEYKLNEKKGTMAKISLGYLMSKGIQSFTPSLFQNLIVQSNVNSLGYNFTPGDFNFIVFLEFFGLNKMSSLVNTKTDIELTRVINDISHQINGRITDSLFFQEFEFMHEKSLGEIFETIERGKRSTIQILDDTISQFAPTLAGAAMSAAFLTKINPILGAISAAGYPLMWQRAKKQNKKNLEMYEKERNKGEEITNRIDSIKSGFENVKTSPQTPLIARDVKEQMNDKDDISMNRSIEMMKMRLKTMIPFDVSSIVAVGVGGALQQAGLISGGAVLSNVIYTDRLNGPIQNLVRLYYNNFSRYIKDIERMEEILGSYEKLDLPEGKKEKDRVPVSELKNFDISIKNLQYKDKKSGKAILENINLDIKEGEFLTIAGASGAGKSTLLRNLVGLYKPDGGDIKIGGIKNEKIKKYGKESIYSIMSYCNQTPQIFEGMTLRENLLLWSKDEVDDEKIKKVLEDLHMDKFIEKLDDKDWNWKNLSGGEKVRIGVARTLIKGAKIMLLDEPTASLDSQSGTEVRKIIGEISQKYSDTTIICVSHDEELINLSKRVVNMADL